MKIEDLEKAVRLKEQIDEVKANLKKIKSLKRSCGLSLNICGYSAGYASNEIDYKVRYNKEFALGVLDSDESYFLEKLNSLEKELDSL